MAAAHLKRFPMDTLIFDPKEYPMNPAWLIGKRPAHGEPKEEPGAADENITGN